MWRKQEHIFPKGVWECFPGKGTEADGEGMEVGGGSSPALPCTWLWGMRPTLTAWLHLQALSRA